MQRITAVNKYIVVMEPSVNRRWQKRNYLIVEQRVDVVGIKEIQVIEHRIWHSNQTLKISQLARQPSIILKKTGNNIQF